jgi:hypothetical protein
MCSILAQKGMLCPKVFGVMAGLSVTTRRALIGGPRRTRIALLYMGAYGRVPWQRPLTLIGSEELPSTKGAG